MTEVERLTAEVERVTKEREEARKRCLDFENREASVCPEDVGFEEYITALKAENAELRADRERRSLLMMEAALSLISYERSYGGGSGEDEAIELAIFCGYPDDEPRTAEEVQIWLTGAIDAARKAKVDAIVQEGRKQ